MRLTLADVRFAFPELTADRAADLLRMLMQTYREGVRDGARDGSHAAGANPARPAVVDSPLTVKA